MTSGHKYEARRKHRAVLREARMIAIVALMLALFVVIMKFT